MILVTVSVQGEPDTKPLTSVFEYESESDTMLLESARQVKGRISDGLRININESLVLFVHLVVTDLAAGRAIHEIQKRASEILSSNDVLIGVAESMQSIVFTVVLDSSEYKVEVESPICS